MPDRLGQRLDNYHLLRLLGTGSFGEVYLAEQVYQKEIVAIKVLPQQAESDLISFLNEARTMRLRHPHIVSVRDFGVDQHTPFIVMDYAPNGTLRQRHPRGSRLPLTAIIPYVMQVASALQYAHNERIIHRDIKPENLLIGKQNEILVSDFGIAIIAHSTGSRNAQEMAGTIAYMAPEQVQGRPLLASDQYALGVIVYEWLSGERPFNGTAMEMVTQQMIKQPPPLSERQVPISLDAERILMTALEKDPQRRFTSIQAFANALAQAAQVSPYTLTSQREALSSVLPASTPTIVASKQQNNSVSTDPFTGQESAHQQQTQSVSGRHTVVDRPEQLAAQATSRSVSRRSLLLGLGLGGAIMLGAGAGGFIWYENSIKAASPSRPTPATTQQAVATAQPTQDSTTPQPTQAGPVTSSQKFSNSDLNMSLSYPSSWTTDPATKSANEINVHIYPPDPLTVADVYLIHHTASASASIASADALNQTTITELSTKTNTTLSQQSGTQTQVSNKQSIPIANPQPTVGGVKWTRNDATFSIDSSSIPAITMRVASISVRRGTDYYTILVDAPESDFETNMNNYFQPMLDSVQFLS